MVDINLLPENQREREEKAKRSAAKQPHEPVFTLTNPPPLKPPTIHRPVAPKPSPVARAAQAAPPLPAPPPLSAAGVAVVRPKPPVAPDGPLHAAPKAGADAARVNLLRAPAPLTAPAARPASEAATAEAEAMLSAAVKRELARTPVAVSTPPSRHRRSFWAWLRSLFARHPREPLPPVPKVVFVPLPKAPLASRPLPAPAVKHPAPGKLKVPLPPPALVAAAPGAGEPAPAAVPAAAPTHRRHWWAWWRRHPRPVKPIAATVQPTPSAVTPAVLHPPEPHARAQRHWWPWHRRPRAPHPPRLHAVLPPPVVHSPPATVAVPRVPTPSLPQRHRRGLWAWLTSLFARHPRSPKLPPVPAVVLPRPAPPVPKPPPVPSEALATPPAPASTPTAAATGSPTPTAIPSPAQPLAPARPVSTPAWPPRRGTPGVGAPPHAAAGPHPARGVVGRPVRTLAVNLIPSDLSVSAGSRPRAKLIGLAAVAVASALVVVGLQQWVRWYEVQIGTQVKATEAQITQLTAAIAGYEQFRLEGEALQAQIKTVEAALGRHFYWTKIFERLEHYTIPEVYYTSFTASVDGSLTLTAVGRDYQSVARQLVAFQAASDFVASVTITSASADYDTLPPGVLAERRKAAPPGTAVADSTISATHFQVSLTLLPDVFVQQFVTQRAP